MRRLAILRSDGNARLGILLTMLAASILLAGAERISNQASTQTAINSTIVVQTIEGRLYGAGVIIGDGHYMLTVNHVVDEQLSKNQPVMIRYQDGYVTEAQLIKRNRTFDVALFRLKEAHAKGLSVASEENFDIGTPITIIGHPFGITWYVTNGIISRKSYFPPNDNGTQFVIWTNAWIEGGNSGGPLIASGKVIGLVMAYVNPRGAELGAQHLNICVSGSEILRFLEN